MASAEENLVSDCVDRREKDDHHIRLCLESGVLFSSCFAPSSPPSSPFLLQCVPGIFLCVGDARVD